MDGFKNHVDTVIVLTAVIGCFCWMSNQLADIRQDIAIIKTVLVMKGIMPQELANSDTKQ